MKRMNIFLTAVLSLILMGGSTANVAAQGMMGQGNPVAQAPDDHTAREEAEGKAIWERLQSKQVTCAQLSDDDFGALGEYFMGQMAGSTQQHAAMNQMMTNMMGEAGEEQMHVAMGKRRSECDTNAPVPQTMTGSGMMPMMMGMMGGGWTGYGSSSFAGRNYPNNPMMKGERSPLSAGNLMANPMMWNFGNSPMGWFGYGFGWLFMVLWWVLIIVGTVALIKWLVNQNRGESKGKSALDILKERYARGDIDKREFEEKKKDVA